MIRELNCYSAADAVLAVSDKETELINDFAADPFLSHTVPLCQDAPEVLAPFEERSGILFVGNFWHRPNVEAVEFLCREIVPRLDPRLLADHPIYVVGNQLNDTIRALAKDLPHVRMVGWVPTLDPYLQRARVSAVPLLHGAGTKGKVIQSLMYGLPVATTLIGAEGLNLEHGRHALIADDPAEFAGAITQLLRKKAVWQRLQRAGREHIAKAHGHATVKARLDEVIRCVRERPRIAPSAHAGVTAAPARISYAAVIAGIRQLVASHVPLEATVIVVSKGDDELVRFDGRQGWHFPRNEEGIWAGYHPRDSGAAIAEIEALRKKGAGYFLLPTMTCWWLEHYAGLCEHLTTRCREVARDEAGILYALDSGNSVSQPSMATRSNGVSKLSSGSLLPHAAVVEIFRPRLSARLKEGLKSHDAESASVLVLGIYLANKLNNSDDTIAILSQPTRHKVTQRWIGLGDVAPSMRVAEVTARTLLERVPKFVLLNELIALEDLASYDYVLLMDDDVVLPNCFIEHYISLQQRLGFAIAQPARTANSFTDHPIVEQQQGVLARRTRFVEIGPVVSFHRSAYDLVFPFETANAMGWGYENVWSHEIERRGMSMGIIDALSVDHSLRQPVAHYNWSEADEQRAAYFQAHPHFSYDECFRVLDVIPFQTP